MVYCPRKLYILNTCEKSGETKKSPYFCTMYILLISIVIGLFVAMLFVNIYFRAKVLRAYGILERNKVEFGAAHLFNRKKMEAEILPRYPNLQKEILTFVDYIHKSIRMASVLIALITAFGAILMWYRNSIN